MNSAKTHIREMLRDRGYKVYTVPWVSSLANESGGMMILSNLNDSGTMKFQVFILFSLKLICKNSFLGISREIADEFGRLFHDIGNNRWGKNHNSLR